ncbi:MAG: hypothetical protein ABSC53_06035 [Bacteroidota bacterium]
MVIQQIEEESKQNLLPRANLLGEIKRLREDLNAECDRHLLLMVDFAHPM